MKEYELEVPADKKVAFDKTWKENYRTKSEYDNAVSQRDNYKSSLDDVNAKLKEFEGVDVNDLQGQGYGALKNRCTEVVLDTLLPIQTEHARLMADKGYLQSILDENAQRANYLAQKTLRKIQKKVGFAARQG